MYSVNQVTQLYVIKRLNQTISSASTAGDLSAMLGNDDFKYFKYMGAGGVIATDRIKKCKVKWITYTDAAQMDQYPRVTTITLAANPVAGQNYIINFSFRNYFGMSDEDTYEKHASARAFTGDTKPDIYKRLAISLAKNLSREIDKPFAVYLTESGQDDTPVTELSKEDTLTAPSSAFDGIKIVELEQPWQLGRYKFNRPNYTIHLIPIIVSGVEDYKWATITDSEGSTAIGNGKETADFEWFCMGERGDQYRGKDWPLSITTPSSLLVDPTKKYNYLWVHFWDDIDNEGPQKSERDMVFISDTTLNLDLFALGASIADFAGLDGMKANGSAVSPTKVATPVITIDGDTDKATITCATPGATILYAAGSTSLAALTTINSSYSTPVDVSTNIYIKAKATKSGMTDSDTAEGTNSNS